MKKIIIYLLLSLSILDNKCEETNNPKTGDQKTTPSQQEKKYIILMFSPPRSCSTAILRSFGARKDFSVFNEPMAPVAESSQDPNRRPQYFREDSLYTFDKVKKRILEKAKEHHVFVKEIHGIPPFYFNDKEFMNLDNLRIILLIRDPHAMFLSLYKKQIKVDESLAKTEEEKRKIHQHQSIDRFSTTPYKRMLYNCEQFKEHAKYPPIIIRAEDMYTYPEQTARKLCEKIGIPFTPEMLSWKPFDNNFDGIKEWHEEKKAFSLHFWHDAAIKSSGFKKPETYEVDLQGNPTWSEVQHPDDVKLCKEAYERNLPFYKKLLEQKDLIL